MERLVTGALVVEVEDPSVADISALLAVHLAFARGTTPPEFSFALDVDALREPGVTFFSARRDGELVGVAALKRLDPTHVELKSMHVRDTVRGQGVGSALVDHLVAFARDAGYSRVSLETGTMEEFAPARRLYTRAGFLPCAPFGDYEDTAYNMCMSLSLT